MNVLLFEINVCVIIAAVHGESERKRKIKRYVRLEKRRQRRSLDEHRKINQEEALIYYQQCTRQTHTHINTWQRHTIEDRESTHMMWVITYTRTRVHKWMIENEMKLNKKIYVCLGIEIVNVPHRKRWRQRFCPCPSTLSSISHSCWQACQKIRHAKKKQERFWSDQCVRVYVCVCVCVCLSGETQMTSFDHLVLSMIQTSFPLR